MRAIIFITLIGLVVSNAFAGLPVEPKIGEKTDNPQKYVLAHAEFPEQGLAQFDCAHCSAMKDLLFVAATEECGNISCNFYVFRKVGNSYEYLTNVGASHGSFQFLQTKHHGMNDILNYHHMSAFEGILSKEEFDGKDYRFAGKGKTIKSADFAKYINPEPVEQIYFSKDLKQIVK